MKSKRFFTPLMITYIGVMTALGTVIYLFFPEIPLVPGVEYLKVDVSDLPAILLGITVHPLAGVLVEVFKNGIHLLKTTTMGIGEVMNIGIGSAVIVSLCGCMTFGSKVLRKDKWHPTVYFSAAALTILATVFVGWLLNWLLTPLYYRAMGWPLTTELLAAGVFGSTALNVVKAAINLLPFYPLYRAVSKAVKRLH